MDVTTIYGGGYLCSECNQWNRTSALCHHDNLIETNMNSNLQRILEEFEKYKGQFVITESWNVERLIAIGNDEQDYYYVTYNGRKTKWNTCVGSIITLKDKLSEKEYNKFIRTAKLNHWDQRSVWGSHDEEFISKHKVEVTNVNETDKFLTEICWHLN